MNKLLSIATPAALLAGIAVLSTVSPPAAAQAQLGEYGQICKATLDLFYEGPGSDTPFSQYPHLNEDQKRMLGGPGTRRGYAANAPQAARLSACRCVQGAFDRSGSARNYIIENSVKYSDNGHEYLEISFWNLSEQQSGLSRHGDAARIVGDWLRGRTGQRSQTDLVWQFRKEAGNCVSAIDPTDRKPLQSWAGNRWWTAMLFQ